MKTITRNGQTCIYDPALHRYTIDGQALRNVTSVVKSYKPEFRLHPKVLAATIKKNKCRSKKQLFAMWEAKGKASMDEGTAVHSIIESDLSGKLCTVYPEIRDKYTCLGRLVNFLKSEFKDIETEKIVWSTSLNLAGTIDFIGYNSGVHILDFKTGKFETTNKYGEYMLPPFDTYHNCQLNVYSLQLGLYQKIVEHEQLYAVPVKKSIIWIQPDRYSIIDTVSISFSEIV